MNVLFVNYGDFSTNSLNHIGPFANELKRRGHACVVVVPKIGDSIGCIDEKLFDTGTYNDLLTSKIHFMDGRPADIVHAWTPRIHVSEFVQNYRQKHNPKLVVHIEDNEESLIESFYKQSISELENKANNKPNCSWEKALSHPIEYKGFLSTADGCTVIIDSLREFVPNDTPTMELRPGIDFNRLKKHIEFSEFRKELSIPEQTKLLVYPGGISSSNIDDVVSLYKGLKILHQKGIDLKLVKTGPNTPELEKRLGFRTDDFVIDLGFISKSKLYQAIAAADLLVQPGGDDRFNRYRLPSKLPEFLAIGRPVITGNTNIGLELIDENACIPLLHSEPEHIARTVETAFSNLSQKDTIATNGKKYAQKHFGLSQKAEDLEAFYQRLLEGQSSSRTQRRKSSRSARPKGEWLSRAKEKVWEFASSFRTRKLPFDSLPSQSNALDFGPPPQDPSQELEYSEWINFERKRIKKLRAQFLNTDTSHPSWPTISILIPVHKVEIRFLKAAIDSVLDQIYPNWELCIAEDQSGDSKIKNALAEYSKNDARVKVTYREESGHISAASNSALKLSSAEYIGLLDHDDLLAPHALLLVAQAIRNKRTANIIYSDEDKIDQSDTRFDPHFKTSWNPPLLLGQNYINHFCVLKKSLVCSVGSFRVGFEGAQDWDLLMRASEHSDPGDIIHIPEVLYHWRTIPTSTASSPDGKPYAETAANRALQSHTSQFSPSAEPTKNESGHFYIRFNIKDSNYNSLVIAPFPQTQQTQENFNRLIESSKLSPKTEIVFLESNSTADKKNNSSNFSFSTASFTSKEINHLISQTKPDQIILLGSEVAPSSSRDLQHIFEYTSIMRFGAVSGRILKQNERIESIGTTLNEETLYTRLFEGLSNQDDGYFQRANLMSAVTACDPSAFAFRKSIWDEVEGFDESLDTESACLDFCLKIHSRGYQNLVLPHISFTSNNPFTEQNPSTSSTSQHKTIHKRWSKIICDDPLLNSNLVHRTGRYKLNRSE